MTMKTNFQALCEELVAIFDVYSEDSNLLGIYDDLSAKGESVIDRARAALAAELVAEGMGPTDEDLDRLERQHWEETGVEEWGRREAIFNHRAFARAVLSRWGHQTAPVAESEVKDRVTWLQKFAAVDWIADETADKLYATAKLLEQCYCPASVPVGEVRYDKDVCRMCEIILGNTFGNKELDSLALLVGHHPDVLNASTVPVSASLPVAAGEVGVLLRELRDAAFDLNGSDPAKWMLTRAADLLEQRHPTPVPVSERLPGAGDCDEEGRCWAGTRKSVDTSGDRDIDLPPSWELREVCAQDDVWLPATALPLPAEEVK